MNRVPLLDVVRRFRADENGAATLETVILIGLAAIAASATWGLWRLIQPWIERTIQEMLLW